MPTTPNRPIPISWDQVTAFRLARHHLLQPAPAGSLVGVAGEIGGVQAQLLSAAHLGLRARVAGLSASQIDAATQERHLVKAHAMRRTLFLVPGRLLAVFVRGSSRRAEKEIRWALGKGVPASAIEAAIEATLEVLEAPLTRLEIAERVCRKLGEPLQAVEGGGWGSRRQLAAVPVGHLHYPVWDLLHLVAARGVVCYGPSRGNELTFVRAEAWIPGWNDLPVEQAESALLRLYLHAFGPATAADFALWSGMTLTDARQLWEHEQPGFTPVDVEGWESEILQEDLDSLAQAGLEDPPVRLLPYFDTFLLGHKGRDHLVEPEHRNDIFRPQGWIAPVVLAGGRAAGVWEHTRHKDRLQVRVRLFGKLSAGLEDGIQAEALDLARFLASPSVDVQFA